MVCILTTLRAPTLDRSILVLLLCGHPMEPQQRNIDRTMHCVQSAVLHRPPPPATGDDSVSRHHGHRGIDSFLRRLLATKDDYDGGFRPNHVLWTWDWWQGLVAGCTTCTMATATCLFASFDLPFLLSHSPPKPQYFNHVEASPLRQAFDRHGHRPATAHQEPRPSDLSRRVV